MEFIIVGLFALLMGAGAVTVVFHGGEKEGICEYGYKEEGETAAENEWEYTADGRRWPR